MTDLPKPPRTYEDFTERFPKLAEAWRTIGEAAREGPLDEKTARLVKLGVNYEAEWVPDVRPGRRYSAEHATEREARSLLDRLESKETVIALHARGEQFTSRRLADLVERWATPRATPVASVRAPMACSAASTAA